MPCLIISVPPKITYDDKLKEPLVQKADSTATIPTKITGVPNPTVQWFFNDTALVMDERISVETRKETSTISIARATGKDSGTYKVVAENKVGKDEATFTLTVRGKCMIKNP